MAHPAVFSGHEARLTRYQNILSKLSSNNDDTAEGNQGAVEWLLGDEDNVEILEQDITIKEGSAGPLVGTFADAAAAAV
jgi:hypothetical protein